MIERSPVAALSGILCVLGALLLLITEFVVVPRTVVGPSMRPTLVDGDRILVDLWTLRQRRPRRGELVVVADPDHPGSSLVKRVLDSPDGRQSDGVWLGGDNPRSSRDSRRFGAVGRDRIQGRVVGCYWPPRHAGSPGPSPTGLRLPEQ